MQVVFKMVRELFAVMSIQVRPSVAGRAWNARTIVTKSSQVAVKATVGTGRWQPGVSVTVTAALPGDLDDTGSE